MSELVQNLQQIYNIKLQIKDVLDTESDVFSDYPDLIEEAISEGGGSATPVDPWYGYYGTDTMITEEMSSADYVGSVISDNFTVTLDANDEEVEAVEWDENVVIDVEGTNVDKVVHVIVNGDPHEILGSASDIAQDLEDYSDLYNNIYPILENATLTASEDPQTDGYDYLLEGDIYAWNLGDNCNAVLRITNNGFYGTGAALGFNVDVAAQGITAGKYYFFNWLNRDSANAGTISLVNPLKADLRIVNLDQLNFMDEGVQTTNPYFEVHFYEDSRMSTEVEFDDVSDAYTDGDNQLNLFKDLTNNDTIKYVKAEYYVWESNIDPDTGIDSGSFELDDTYAGEFSNPLTITSTDEVVASINLGNNGYRVGLFINGISVEGNSATLSVV